MLVELLLGLKIIVMFWEVQLSGTVSLLDLNRLMFHSFISQSLPLVSDCASPGLFIGEFQLPSGLFVVHSRLGSAILRMERHSNGAPGARVPHYSHRQHACTLTHSQHPLTKGEDASMVIIQDSDGGDQRLH